MTFFAISMPCWAPASWGKALRFSLLALVLAATSLLPLAGAAAAQEGDLPGVRGNLYESPAFGFVVLLPQDGGWTFQTASSDADGDYVQAIHPSGAVYLVSGYQDASSDEYGCVQGIQDALAAAYPNAALTDWEGNEPAIASSWPDTAQVQVLASDPAGGNVFASISCAQNAGDLLLAELLLEPSSLVESGDVPSSLLVQAPGQGNTGRPWPDTAAPAPGVVLFAARGLPIATAQVSVPFSCLDQESFEIPPDPAPAGTGYFACDGQAANVDDHPVTLDLAGFAIGCLPGLPVDPEAGACPDAPVRASFAQVLDTSTGEVGGSTVTLDPGEYVDLVVWFALPDGLPPQDVLYIEGDTTFQAGTSYFSAGVGSRPRVRMTR
ncbi:MAG: hypothetical protein R2853_09215 [Thermomicrobiales bacterium]